ncbi:MAG TPA: SusC/RagA family TonB-linked outer membrane protein, partial [Bacteroidales bacterium]|nr:SusC/RagA family TonB-linked outer membrane protein [Bacteroidales bacterium]
MKISFLLILGTCLQVSASLYSQDVRLDIAVNKMSVKDVLKMVENKSTYRFFYSDDFSVLDKLVSLHVENSSLDGFLDALLQNTNASYKVLEKNIVVISPFSLQQQKVTGKVVDANTGEPIVGANIVIEGTTLGTVTDADGSYSLDVARPNAVLVVSFIGFMTERINYTGQSTLEIKLVPDIKNLEEVVVVGYGVQKKTNLTGAVGSVDGEMLEARPVQNASQMLQGMIPGLNITQSSGGSMENKASINIRGTATIGSGSTGNPLVLIDGMEGDINAINPQDIENISVLKDVAASSIYGSRAPFGVILVTTKKGKQGRTVVNYNNSLRWSSPINMPDMMDSYTFALYFNDAYRNGGSSPFFSDEWLQRIKDYQDGKIKTTTVVNPNNTKYWKDGYGGGNDNVDWYDALYRNYSFAQEHNLSATGGNERTQYYFSGNILDQDGLMEFNQDKFKRYTGTVKITSQLGKWISANVNSRFVREDYGRPSNMSDGLFQDLARQGWPILPLYDPNGFLYSSPSPALGLRDGGRDKSQKDWLYEQVQLIFEPIKGWRTFGEFNYRINDNFRHWDIQKLYNHDVNGDPYEYSSSSHVYEYGYRENFFSTNIYTEYSKDINDAHHFKGMLGFQNEKENYRDLSATNYGITVSSIPALDATSGIVNGSTVAASVSGQYQKWSTAGFFGRLNYDYKGRYL